MQPDKMFEDPVPRRRSLEPEQGGAHGEAHAMREQTAEERTQSELAKFFTYHPPTQDQIPRYNDIRTAARPLASIIYRACRNGPDRSAAIRKLRECVMTANAAIAIDG